MEVDARAFLLDEVEEAVVDPVVVSSLSRNSKAVMKKWIVIPSSAPVSTPGDEHNQLWG